MNRIRIFAVLDNVNEDNVEKLEKTVESFQRELVKIDAKEVAALMEKLGVPKYRGSYATHYRKFFQLFVPNDVHRLLYIDSDSIVTGNLEQLTELDMEGKCIGVVLDTLGGRYKELLGFQPCEPYFNAGVTLIDVDAWKERNYSKKLVDYIQNVRAKFCNPDQDLFNLVLKGDTFVLPLEYNFQPAHRAYSDKSYFKNYPKEYYTSDEIEYARRNPMILHTYRFLGEFPWHKGNLHPDNDIFDEYLKKSEWSAYVKKKANLSVMFKIEKAMYRVLPRAVFLFIFQKMMYRSFYNKNLRLKKE